VNIVNTLAVITKSIPMEFCADQRTDDDRLEQLAAAARAELETIRTAVFSLSVSRVKFGWIMQTVKSAIGPRQGFCAWTEEHLSVSHTVVCQAMKLAACHFTPDLAEIGRRRSLGLDVSGIRPGPPLATQIEAARCSSLNALNHLTGVVSPEKPRHRTRGPKRPEVVTTDDGEPFVDLGSGEKDAPAIEPAVTDLDDDKPAGHLDQTMFTEAEAKAIEHHRNGSTHPVTGRPCRLGRYPEPPTLCHSKVYAAYREAIGRCTHAIVGLDTSVLTSLEAKMIVMAIRPLLDLHAQLKGTYQHEGRGLGADRGSAGHWRNNNDD
jgi:hypothetical protein